MKKILKRLLIYLAIIMVFFIAYLAYLYDDAIAVSRGIPIVEYEQPKMALLVIDVQEGTTGGISVDQYYKDQASELIGRVNEAITIAYDSGVLVVYIQQQTENWFLNWADGYVLAKGHPGVALDSRLKMVSLNHFPKRIMDAFSNPNLDKFLTGQQVDRLLITGLDVAYCANKTSRAALNRGYEVIILREAVISESAALKEEKLSELESVGAVVTNLASLPELISR